MRLSGYSLLRRYHQKLPRQEARGQHERGQPQTLLPTNFPLRAGRITIGWPHFGQLGAASRTQPPKVDDIVGQISPELCVSNKHYDGVNKVRTDREQCRCRASESDENMPRSGRASFNH